MKSQSVPLGETEPRNIQYRRTKEGTRPLIILSQTWGFVDTGFVGPAFTWKNRRFSSTLVQARLDRALVSPSRDSLFQS